LKSGASNIVPLVSIVTLNYNGLDFLPQLFDSLRQITYPNVEIIMVDNYSDDASVAFVEKNYPEVRVVRNPENYMYAKGNNVGIRHAQGKYVCLLNNDVEVEPDFIEPIVAAMENNPVIAAAQPKIRGLQKRDYLEYAGACGGYIDWLGYPFLRGRIFFTTEKDEGQYDDPAPVFWASGACLFLRREALDDVGYLDEDFVIHMEEIDLCWRLQLAGWEVVVIPQSVIYHYVGGTLDQANPRKTYWNFRNNIFLMAKNLSKRNLAKRLPLRIFLDSLAFLSEFVKGHWKNAFAVVRAYYWIFSHSFIITRNRFRTQRLRRRSDSEVLRKMYPGSIVLEYFLLKRKKFSDLLFLNRFLSRINHVNIDTHWRHKTGVQNVYEK